MDNRININVVTDLLEKDFNMALDKMNKFGKAVYHCPPGIVADDTTKLLIYNTLGEKVAFLICSLQKYSDIPERSLYYSKQIKKALGADAGKVVLEPLIHGKTEGIIYILWPYCNPVSTNRFLKRIQLFKLKPALFNWIKLSTQLTLKKPTSNELEKRFLIPLTTLIKNTGIDTTIYNEIDATITRLKNDTWKPYFVMAHNDLWLNNILLKGNSWDDFVIIDWAGGRLKSYGIYDLVRISKDMNLSEKQFHSEIKKHCKILECEIEDSKSYLLSSLAYLGMNLDQFPEDKYLALVKTCSNYLFSSLKSITT